MKNAGLMLLIAILPFLLVAQNNTPETPVNSRIERVTVFLQGAQVIRKAETNLPKGKSVLVLKGLSPQMDPASVKVSADGNFTLLSVNHRRNFTEQQEKTARVAALEKRIQVLKDSAILEKTLKGVLEKEAAFLQANQNIGGRDQAFTLSSLKEISQYYVNRLREISLEQLRIDNRLKELDIALAAQQNQLKEFQAQQARVSGEVVLTVSAEAPAKAAFELSYLAGSAGWFPAYDIKVTAINQPIDLRYKAGVYQNTGEDWNNVRLRFSNGNPTESGSLPYLTPFYLAPFSPVAPASYNMRGGSYNPNVRTVTGRITDESGEPLIGATITVKGTAVGTIADLNGDYSLTIPEGGRELVVSFIGFTTTELAISQPRMDVRMESGAMLEEVVVTAYGMNRDAGSRPKAAKAAAPPPLATIENATTVEFELQVPFTVPSDGEKYTVDLAAPNLTASYEYQAVPKLEKSAYLTAFVTDWEQYNLLEGEANLFFEDTYLGRSVLDTRYLADTLKLSLGRDRGVAIDRQSVREFTRRNLIGSRKTESRTYKIVVRNGKAQPIRLLLTDQIPVSQNKEIEVQALNISSGQLEAETGKVSWVLQLAPGEQKELTLQYEVRYPKEMTIRLE